MTSPKDIQQIYIAYFSRPADTASVAYWISGERAGMTAAQIAQALSLQPEYAQAFAGLNTAQTVNTLYKNLFNHDADPAGLAYWKGQIDSGAATIGQAAMGILRGAAGADAETISAKHVSAYLFSASLESDLAAQTAYGTAHGESMALVKSWLSGVGYRHSMTDVTSSLDTVVARLASHGGDNLSGSLGGSLGDHDCHAFMGNPAPGAAALANAFEPMAGAGEIVVKLTGVASPSAAGDIPI